jgi:23S rRNA (adenine2030-N6)-methyltransferase
VNYRHAFHAGNFADCMKHALLVTLLRALARKPTPFRVLDTHAGIGRYDLLHGEAQRTGEWREGIARLQAAPDPALADYLSLVGTDGTYPGSPALAARLLRAQDRLALSSCTRPTTPPCAPCSSATRASRSTTATAGRPPAR